MASFVDEELKKQLEDAFVLEYKGIFFDAWTVDEYGVWGEVCEDCAEKHKDIFTDELDPGGVGACSVRLCDVVGMDSDNESHFYVDFHPELIKPLTREEFYRLYPEQEALDDKIAAALNKMSLEPVCNKPDRSDLDRY